jgi:hypothetical protein
MIVKKTKQLGNFKKGINLYVPRKRISATPTTLPLSTPNLYFSGLTFYNPYSVGVTYYDINFQNPYTRNSNELWRGGRYAYVQDQLNYVGGSWNLMANCYIDDGYDYYETSIVVATNSAPSSAIPLAGWVNQGSVMAGTLVIRTTP